MVDLGGWQMQEINFYRIWISNNNMQKKYFTLTYWTPKVGSKGQIGLLFG